MSARPRPVTATFKPRSMAPPTGVRTRSYSLSSGTSTESLVSILDHDSYESLEDSDTERTPTKSKTTNTVSATESTGTSRTRTRSSNTTYSKAERPQSAKLPGPGASWENWMIEKAKELRLKQKAELEKERKKQEEEKKKLDDKKRKMIEGEEKIKEWVEKKNIREKLQKKRIQQQEKSKREIEESEKQKNLEKSKCKFDEWMQEKANKEKEAKKAAQEKKRKEQEEKEEKQRKAQAAFDEWCQKAQKRPRSVHSSLGYTSGKLTGYYDGNANPVPSFCNPKPWIPVEVPTVKAPRKRSKSARRWNPDKYF